MDLHCLKTGIWCSRIVNGLNQQNAGALATTGYGTALAVIRSAVARGLHVEVYATETRPVLQGARLTAFELLMDRIPFKLVTDNAVGFLMRRKLVDKVIVGADRIALNGDVINKIGTYMLAVLANHHGIPFYVAAPMSTIDPKLEHGDDAPIEFRSEGEVVTIYGRKIAPEGVEALNPAFDVTPSKLITAIITELGVFKIPDDLDRLRNIRLEKSI